MRQVFGWCAVVAAASVISAGQVRADVFSNVPEASQYTLVYTLPLQNAGKYYDTTPVPYTMDRAGLIRNGYDRVAYYLEVVSNSVAKWVYVSMNDFAHGSVRALGLPHNRNNPVAHQTLVRSMNVYASANLAGLVTTGSGIQTGNVEMWPGNYGVANAFGVTGAGASAFDFGDENTGGVGTGHGSFQVHNYGAGQVLFAYNNFGNAIGSNGTLGIGSQQRGEPDWTFNYNAAAYTTKTLQILVRERAGDLNNRAATLRSRVPEAAGFLLVQDLSIPNGYQGFNRWGVPYAFDRAGSFASSLARVAYYMELDANWVYVSSDPFTQDARLLGVPASAGNGGGNFQQVLTHMNVSAAVGSGIVNGTDIGTGNIEFWSSDYSAGNGISIPNASATAYDFGDTKTANNTYGSMQIHNYDLDGAGAGVAGQTLFAYNCWGYKTSGTTELGIGNRATVQPDWTFAQNAESYTSKRLQVLARPTLLANVAEASQYRLIYALNIPAFGVFKNDVSVPYAVNNSNAKLHHGFDRVAYYMELDTGTGLKWVYVSMPDFAGQSLRALGLPHNLDNPVIHQRTVTNLNIYASANLAGVITTGTAIQTGNLEMWPGNYTTATTLSLPGGSGSAYDFDDSGAATSAGHGTFQIHNYGAAQTLLSYGRWGGGNLTGYSDLGIGRQSTGAPDWTNAQNAQNYTVKNLWIMVRERAGDPQTRTETLRNRVGEAAKYELVYDLAIPRLAKYNTQVIPYTIDRSSTIPASSFGRVAFHLELDNKWVYTSMNAFTLDLRKVGVPSKGPNGNGAATFQMRLTNLNVYASTDANVTTGTGIQTGNIEFWGHNYQNANGASVPNATGAFDFGDTVSTGNYGSMQIHNYDFDGAGPGIAGQTVFAYNRWGNAGDDNTDSDIGFGNRAATDPDWTFAQNANSYTLKHLQVLVRPRVYDNVPEADKYMVAYALEIPRSGFTDFNTCGVPYGIDHAARLGSEAFGRVAYYLELKKPGQAMQWVFVSFDAFTQDIAKIGVPNSAVGTVWQQNVYRMNVVASPGAPVTTGSFINTGNLEFWPNNYGTASIPAVPGASGTTYDFGDDPDGNVPAGYGSMQVHNYGTGETIFAYNGWGNPTMTGCIGIGTNPGPTGQPDWTHYDNASTYEIANLFIMVQVPTPGTIFSLH